MSYPVRNPEVMKTVYMGVSSHHQCKCRWFPNCLFSIEFRTVAVLIILHEIDIPGDYFDDVGVGMNASSHAFRRKLDDHFSTSKMQEMWFTRIKGQCCSQGDDILPCRDVKSQCGDLFNSSISYVDVRRGPSRTFYVSRSYIDVHTLSAICRSRNAKSLSFLILD